MQALRHFVFWEMFLNALRNFYIFILKGSKKVVNSFCTTKQDTFYIKQQAAVLVAFFFPIVPFLHLQNRMLRVHNS